MIDTLWTHQDLLRLAYRAAMKHSNDPDTKNGAILAIPDGDSVILVAGANRLPDGVLYSDSRVSREGGKYAMVEHAERDVIFRAAKMGLVTDGAVMFVPWYACDSCARAIIAAGIRCVVGHKAMFDKTPERWRKSIEVGDQMLDEAGVVRDVYDGEVGGCHALFDRQIWYP